MVVIFKTCIFVFHALCIPSIIFNSPVSADDVLKYPVAANISLPVCLAVGVGNIERLRRAGYGLNIERFIEKVFFARKNLDITARFDVYRKSSKGVADFNIDHCQPIRRTLSGFITVSDYFDASTGLVKTDGLDVDQLSNLIAMHLRNPGNDQIRNRLRLEYATCSYRQCLRPVVAAQVVFGHLDVPILSKLFGVSVNIFIPGSTGALNLDLKHQFDGGRPSGEVFILFLPLLHRYFVLGFKSASAGQPVNVPIFYLCLLY